MLPVQQSSSNSVVFVIVSAIRKARELQLKIIKAKLEDTNAECENKCLRIGLQETPELNTGLKSFGAVYFHKMFM